jgi:hypothetical protein
MEYSSGIGLGREPKQHYHLWLCDSIKEVADIARDNTNVYNLRGSRKLYDRDFHHTETFDEAYTLAVDGWHDIRGKVDAHLEPIRHRLGQVLAVVRDRMYDYCGNEVDMDRYLSGESECMWDDLYDEQPHNGKVFTMLVDSTLTWQNAADDVAKRGAVLCALVEAFDMMGFQLEIWGEWTVKSQEVSGYASILTRFNTAGEPVDIDSMMFALGSPDWYRRIGFGFGEAQQQMAAFGFSGGYYGMNRNGVHHADRVGASSIVSLDGNQAMMTDPVGWIIDQLDAQGVIDKEDV